MLNSHLPAAQKSSPEALKKLEENYLSESFENWSKRVAIVNIVCDPVKRLLSDFQHYKAEHPNVLKFNAHKFGQNSEFSEMSFDRFVSSHIKNHKKETELGSASRKIFRNILGFGFLGFSEFHVSMLFILISLVLSVFTGLMGFCGFLWVFRVFMGFQGFLSVLVGFLWVFVGFYGFCGFSWVSADLNGFSWVLA